LERAISRYGGGEMWESLESVSLRVAALQGPLPRLKGFQKTFFLPERVEVFPGQCKTVFHGYPNAGTKGVFQKGQVGLFPSEETNFHFDHSNYRETFRGLSKYRRWSPLDALYFFGYAFASYLSYPFILPDHAAQGCQKLRWGERAIDRVSVQFAPDFPTHCARQDFYFDEQGYLLRNDYRADIVGWWALGAHYSLDYQDLKGLPVATQRVVYGRLFGFETRALVLKAVLEPCELTRRSGYRPGDARREKERQ
jgi:hypothetical protein